MTMYQQSILWEKRFLRGLAKKSQGAPVPGEAFGSYCGDDLTHGDAADYNFTITMRGRSLELMIDTYMAINGATREQFDSTAWNDGFFVMTVQPATRGAYVFLHRAARMMLSGLDVRLSPELYAPGIPGATRVKGGNGGHHA